MAAALVVLRLLLAGVFAVAGLAKLADRSGSRQALRGFGVPAALVGPVAILLPLVELATAVALVPATTAWWGAVAAVALLLVFTAAIGVSLARGRTPDCHCFGQVHSAPVGWRTLIRNSVLAGAAAFLVVAARDDPGPSVLAWTRDMTTTETVLLIALVVLVAMVASQGILLVNVMRQSGRMLLRIEALEGGRPQPGGHMHVEETEAPPSGLPMGASAPPFQLRGLHGETHTLDALRAWSRPVLLIFSDPNCGPCNSLMADVGAWQQGYGSHLTVAVVSRGDIEVNRGKTAEYRLVHVLLQQDSEVAAAYEAPGTPSAVLVAPDGTIASPLAVGVDAIRALVARTAAAGTPVPPAAPFPILAAARQSQTPSSGNGAAVGASMPIRAKVGEPAPALRLPDLRGETVDLADFRGRSTVVLFWNPGCGFCEEMLDDLRAWEQDAPAGAPRLLVVSTGTVEANEAMELRSPVVLDQTFSAGSAFGANGTPSAILVDAEGDIASELAVGASAVLDLITGATRAGRA